MKIILLFTLFLLSLGYAQEDQEMRFAGDHKTVGTPFLTPLSISPNGTIHIGSSSEAITLAPMIQFGAQFSSAQYIEPLLQEEFSLGPIDKSLRLIEVQRVRIEAGLGPAALLAGGAFALGIAPYKGAVQVTVRLKSDDKLKLPMIGWPRKFNDLKKWRLDDYGRFQTYGGIQALAGFSIGPASILRGLIGVQSQFVVELKKLSDRKIMLKLSEEKMNKRQLRFGPMVSDLTFAHYKGKRLSAEFMLDLENKLHHELFQAALKGNLNRLQEELNHEEHRLNWEGFEKEAYVGIPLAVGKKVYHGSYDLDEDGEEAAVDILGSKNSGVLLPSRHHQRFVYQTDDGLILYWISEMDRVNQKALEKNFIKHGRSLGLKGFDTEIPSEVKLGSVISQLTLGFSRAELISLGKIKEEGLQEDYRLRCEETELKCKSTKHRRKILAKFKDALTKPFNELHQEIGIILVKEPALVYSILRQLRLEKRVYFKFLSENYQSLEGSAPVQL
jgi:hypothetical protein